MDKAEKLQLDKQYKLGNRSFHYSVLVRIFPFALLWIFAMVTYLSRALFPLSLAQYKIVVIIVQILPSLLFFMGIIIIIFAYLITRMEHQTSTIMVDDSSLHLTRGILNKTESIIPYRKVQSVEIKQSLLFRYLNLARVVITTTFDIEQPYHHADDEANDEVISVIDYPLALMLEDKLTDSSQASHDHN